MEAAGVDIPLMPGDITLRANFATLRRDNDQLTIIDRRAGRIAQDTQTLADALRNIDLGDGITGNLCAATQHRGVVHLRGPALSAGITDTDPGDNNIQMGVQEALPNESSEGAMVTAAALNRFIQIAHLTLKDHPVNQQREARGLLPANGIITRGAGLLEPLSSSISHNRLRAALISGESTVIGLGRLLGYQVITSPNFTAMDDTDIRGKLEAAFQALNEQDIVFIHLKAPDIASHDRAPLKKKAFLERFDQELARYDLTPHTVLISGDHSTDSIAGSHSGDPVPSILYTPGGRSDACHRFGELDCMSGGLGRLNASALLCSTLDSMGAIGQYRTSDAELFGL
jgi:2,3-bisphosphoglycerate-independent phosphoglycerate mutase